MDLESRWEKALKFTEIVRPRIQPLLTFAATDLPYVFLAESAVNTGDTVVRKGHVVVEKPAILLPSDFPQFLGFQAENQPEFNADFVANYLLVRGVRFPSLKYQNVTDSLDVWEGKLSQAAEHHSRLLEQQENTATGLVLGPEDCLPL